jgi:hypothetical protein
MGKLSIDKFNRRNFLKINLAIFSAFIAAQCSVNKKQKARICINDSFSKRGHQLKNKQSTPEVSETIEKEVVIIGGGISGLSAAYHFNKNSPCNMVIYELSDHAGGNSHSGKNSLSAYPYGAHYLTLPNNSNTPLIEFLHEKKIITGFDSKNNPIYNELDLCFDPEERLLIRGTYQEGLIPTFGLNDAEKGEISKFFSLIEEYRAAKGSDGKFFFDTPYSLCSTDPKYDNLDHINFSQFLTSKELKSNYLLWYLDYCCKDDFGGDTKQVSAWAGINYFACRHAEAANTDPSRVLTWPEGNGRLVKLLKENITPEQLRTGMLVKKVSAYNNYVEILLQDQKTNKFILTKTKKCIVAIPPFVAQKIIDPALPYAFEYVKELPHSPWMVAAITLDNIPEARGMDLCWDNVAYKQRSLGYIFDQHQELDRKDEKKVLSLYFTFNEDDPKKARSRISNFSEQDWEKLVYEEMELMHPGVSEFIEEIDVFIWGHGMIMPKKGLIKGGILKGLAKPIDNKLFFAHSDLAGYSTFEEAFDQGLTAFKQASGKT